jgi:MFS family permease
MSVKLSNEHDDTVIDDLKEDHIENVNLVREIDNFRVLGLADDDADFYINFPKERRKQVIRKVDIRLVPMLAILYLISHIDRANIGNAKIEGLDKDLGLTGVQYNTVLSIFFIPYVLLEVPSNILLKKFKRPSVYLGILILCWGIVMTFTGVVTNYAGLMVTRILLGVFEAGFFPGAIYLCSYWYMPKDLATRISYFYCASALSGAFSGLLAAAIAQMDGVGGYQGWRWTFIIEGIATVVLAIACFFLLIDSPTLSHRWLAPEEIRFLEIQLFIKQGGKFQQETGFRWRDLRIVLSNWRLYLQSWFLFAQSATSYGTKFTLPTITQAMGFSTTNAQLMSAPPYIAGAISSILFARLSDRFYWRMPFVALPLTMIFVGYAIILSLKGELAKQMGPAYFSIVLTVMGIYPVQPAAASWNANNLAPASRRAIGIALMNCVGNIGGIVGSFMFIETEKPKYYTGFGLGLALGVSGLLVSFVLEYSYKRANKKKAEVPEHEVRAKYTEDELLDMGDKSPLFKHVL